MIAHRTVPLLTLMLLVAPAHAAPDAGKITVEPWGKPIEQVYDVRHPPEDLAAVPDGHADADASPRVQWEGGSMTGRWDRSTRTLVVNDISEVTLRGRTTVRLPEHVADQLRLHELGHDSLNANEYARSAGALTSAALDGLVGSRFTGEGETDDASRRDAWSKANAERDRRMSGMIAELSHRMDDLAALFDEATTHGRSRLVDTKRGIEIAIQKRDRAAATKPATKPMK